jgi:chorismate dehydratase
MTRIACVRYLNTAPLIEGLSKLDGMTLLPTVPSRIAAMVRSGEADLGLCSIVDAAGDPPLTLAPAGMIGCDGPTLTVRLFSRVPLAEITELHADTDSHTSVVLCRLLLQCLYGAAPRVIDFAATRHVGPLPASVLLIGDKVVTGAPAQEQYPHQLDLGQAWRDLTGLPFVYATWMCLEDRPADPAIHTAAGLLDRQRRRNLARLDWLIARHAPAHAWPVELAGEYLGRLLRYDVGPREREAAQRFFDLASDVGLLPRATLRWLEPVPQTVALQGR